MSWTLEDNRIMFECGPSFPNQMFRIAIADGFVYTYWTEPRDYADAGETWLYLDASCSWEDAETSIKAAHEYLESYMEHPYEI